MFKRKREILAKLYGNNVGVPLRQQLLDGAPFLAELTHSLVLTRGTGSPTFTRADATDCATFRDWEGALKTVPSGCARFQGARMVRNRFSKTEDLTDAAWTPLTTTVTAGQADPDGGTSAFRLLVAAGGGIYQSFGASGEDCTEAWYVKSNTGASQNIRFNIGGTVSANVVATTAWQRLEANAVSTGTIHAILDDGASGADILVWHPQSENVTGQADQTASEYVSVGVESAPYHGAGVDGIEFFNTDRDGALLPSAYTYDAVSLNGVAGTYVSTPDSVAASVAGDIDIRVKVAPVSWSGGYCYASKWDSSGTKSTFVFIGVAGKGLRLFHTADGSTVRTDTATAGVSFADGATGWIRVTRVAATGVVTFYESADGTTWTQVGAPVAGVAEALQDNNASVEIGSYSSGGAASLSGKIYQAQIYNGIDGTLAVDFDASRYAGGTTLTGSTGETWTLQGNAVIHPTNRPNTGYLAEGARTNLCLQSQDFATTWAAGAATITANQAIAPDGTTTMDGFAPSAAVGSHFLYQDIAKAASAITYTYSLWVERNPGQTDNVVLSASDGVAAGWACVFDPDNGDVLSNFQAVGVGFTFVDARLVESTNGAYRFALTITTTATPTIEVVVWSTNTTNSIGNYAGNGVDQFYIWGAQLEPGSSASTYIATTTAAVPREADVLTYTGGDIANLKTLYAGFRREVGVSSVGYNYVLRDLTDTNYIEAPLLDATQYRMLGLPGPWSAISTYTPGAISSAAQSWATNDIKMSFNGATVTPDTNAIAPTGMTHLEIGHYNGVGWFNGNVGPVIGWTRNLSQSELNAITA